MLLIKYSSNISQPKMVHLPLKMSVTEEGLMAETGQTITKPTSHHELQVTKYIYSMNFSSFGYKIVDKNKFQRLYTHSFHLL